MKTLRDMLIGLGCALLIAATILAVVVGLFLVGYGGLSNPLDPDVVKAAETLTAVYGDQTTTIIEDHILVAGSLGADLDPDALSGVMTELKARQYPTSDNRESYWITTDVFTREIHVLEYSPQQFKAIWCGLRDVVEVTSKGEYLGLPNKVFGQGVYVFQNVSDKWKLAAAFPYGYDHHTIERDWFTWYPVERELIGPLLDYADAYEECGRDD